MLPIDSGEICDMSWKVAFALALIPVLAPAAAAGRPVFGSVVTIGGSASDIALDESRGVLYVANMGASVITVISTADNTVRSSINVLPFPGAIALSFDSQYLVVLHYCNQVPPPTTSPPCANQVTSIHLTDNSRRTFSVPDPPLGVAFLGSGQAVMITTTAILSLDPASGTTQVLDTIESLAETLPVAFATFPGQIVQAALVSSSDGTTVWGIASAGTATQLVFQLSGPSQRISASIYVSSPVLLPRISTASDGSYAMIGYALIGAGGVLKGRYPDALTAVNITGNAVDSANGIIYAQLPDSNQSAGPTATGSASPAGVPAMLIMDSDNLTFRDRISIPEDMVGRAVLNAAATVMYVVSESGVMVLPVGSLNSYHRLAAAQEDLFVATSFCGSGALSQSLTITDPGGGQTDFTVSTTQAGVTIVPASGTTPATVQVLVNPAMIPGFGGTTAISLTITSQSAVNWPKPVRLLLNNSDPGQRGTIVDQPGVLSDILSDEPRNRVYVLRQDTNQLLVFDATSFHLIATLRTATSPTMMAMTGDQKSLLVGSDDSQFLGVYDLNSLQAKAPIIMPGGHFARSIAVSNAAVLVLARNEGDPPGGQIDSIDFATRRATALFSLGVYGNDPINVSPTGVLTASPGGASVFLASPDGKVALYSASANTFVNSRHDLAALSGAFAASDYGSFIAGNYMLNASLVPTGLVSLAPAPTSGFIFVDQGGYMASAVTASAPGAMLRLVSPSAGAAAAPVILSEAPLLSTITSPASVAYGTYGSGSVSTHSLNAFTRTVAPVLPTGTLVVLSTSGFTVLAPNYANSVTTPSITAITSAADGTAAVASGELISIYGQNMSSASVGAVGLPLSSLLGNSCLGVNGSPIPLLYVSPSQINAELPFNLVGNATLSVHTPGGTSNNFLFTIQPTAPSVFLTGVAGPETGLATIFRDDNNQLVTPTNPLHPNDRVTIYLTGMGQTTPPGQAGRPAPFSPLAIAAVQPTLTLGGAALLVTYAGLSPGEVGVYQINATVPSVVPGGLSVPLAISQGSGGTTLNVRVVN